MWRTLIQVFKTQSDLRELRDRFVHMMKDTQWMYRTVTGVLLGHAEPADVRDPLYARDREVNDHERGIRRWLVNHLTLHVLADIPAALVFMSVVKDVERIGDYCKNIFEITELYRLTASEARYAVALTEISKEVEGLFGKTEQAFRDSDEEKAQEVLARQQAVAKRCDDLVKQLLQEPLPTSEAVATALLTRHFKRVMRHLGNVASSIVTSVEDIDFYPQREAEK